MDYRDTVIREFAQSETRLIALLAEQAIDAFKWRTLADRFLAELLRERGRYIDLEDQLQALLGVSDRS